MIIDSHIHLMESYGSMKGCRPEEIKAELEARGIEKAWAFTMNGFYGNCSKENDKLKAFCDQCPDMLIPFMTVNPRDGEKAIEEMERAFYELGMKCLKAHGWCQSFSMTDPWFHEMCKKCIDLKIPLVVHDGTPPFTEPFQACYIAEKYPKLRIILAHSGLNDLWKEALYGAERLKNIYLGTCSTPYFALEQMVKHIGSERIIFGSDGGFGDNRIIDNNLSKIYMLDLKEEELDNILYKNAQRMLEW